MNNFKVGDIVFAKAENIEFVDNESGDLFKVVKSNYNYVNIIDGIRPRRSYYYYKFRKATKKEIIKFNFDWMVNKLKGELVIE